MPAPGYPGGTAYAPIISFVPVQTYPGGQVQYGAVYQDPNAYTQPGYVPEQPPAQPEPVVLQPDQFDSYSHQPAPGHRARAPEREVYRSPFEPLIPPEAPPADIPPGGAKPYEDSPDRPLPSASAAEPATPSRGRRATAAGPRPRAHGDVGRDGHPAPARAAVGARGDDGRRAAAPAGQAQARPRPPPEVT